MACDVDELDVNPFFYALQTQFSELYDRAQDKCYTICIPQTTSIQASAINREFAETHILRPSPYFKGELLTTHSNGSSRVVTFDEGGRTITTAEGFPLKLTARIVSEELAYNKEYKQYRVLILNQPLDPKFQRQSSEDGKSHGQKRPAQCVTLAECKQFLHSVPTFSKMLHKVDGSVRLFNTNYMVLPAYLKDAALRLADITTEGVEGCERHVDKQQATDGLWTDALVVAMESYVMSLAAGKVMKVVRQHCAREDNSVRDKCRRQLSAVPLEALGIQPRFVCPLPRAVGELNRLTQLTTPREKLHCLKAVIDAVTGTIAAHLSRDVAPHLALIATDKPSLTSDDLIPILVGVMGQSQCEHIHSELTYMEIFTLASSAKDMDDLSYCLVTFKAAVQYTLDTDFSHLPHKNTWRKQASMDKLSGAVGRLSVSNGSKGDKSPSPRNSPIPLTSSGATASASASASAAATATWAGVDSSRLERHLSRVNKALEDVPAMQARVGQGKTVSSIFGAQYPVPVALETASRSETSPQLGDFLSSLQDDFMDQPFGKQA